VQPFQFEHTHRFQEKEYGALVALLSQKTSRRTVRYVLFMLAGVLLLFSRYTLLLGVLWLGLGLLAVWMPHTFAGTGARTYRESKLLREELTYGVSERELWIHGPEYSATVGWRYLGYWRIREDWLILPCTGIPTVYLPVAALQAAGIFDQVMTLVRRHGKPFDAPAGS
jgi:hypothetical protein